MTYAFQSHNNHLTKVQIYQQYLLVGLLFFLCGIERKWSGALVLRPPPRRPTPAWVSRARAVGLVWHMDELHCSEPWQFSQLGGILFAVWALEEVKWVLMINEHRCLVAIVVVLLGRGPFKSLWADFWVRRDWSTPFFLLRVQCPCHTCPMSAFSKAQASSLPSQAASRAPTLVHQVYRCPFTFYILFGSLRKLIKSGSVIHIKETRQKWGSPCCSFHGLFRAMGPCQSFILAELCFLLWAEMWLDGKAFSSPLKL